MLLRSWLADWIQPFDRLLNHLRRGVRVRKRPIDLQIRTEALEVRCVPATINLGNLGTAGTTFRGIDTDDFSGYSVSGVGDVNGDGFDDILIGAKSANGADNSQPSTGECYLIFGAEGLPGTIELSTLGSRGVIIYGIDTGDLTGKQVSTAGDMNGDGFDDLLISAPRADAVDNAKSSAGEAYVVFGRSSFPATINLSTLGSDGITIFGIDANDYCGDAVASAGDMNGDGYGDIILGADRAYAGDNGKVFAGECYVIFGHPSLPATIELASLGMAGITIYGAAVGDFTGTSVSGGDDLNKDGFDDVVIGATKPPALIGYNTGAGKTYVIFGKASPSETIDLATLGTAGVLITGADSGDYSGHSVSIAGDVNGDGIADLLIGAIGGDAAGNAKVSAGDNYLIFGKSVWPASINLSSLGSSGITICGAGVNEASGRIVTAAGDVNGDGFDDMLFQSDGFNQQLRGIGYLVFGATSLPSTIDLANPAAAGITMIGADTGDASGRAISRAGDVNGDGFADLLVGATNGDGTFDSQSNCGETYVIYGGNSFTNSVSFLGTSGDDFLFGSNGSHSMIGGNGNDVLLGNGGTDVLYGGDGTDVLAIGDLSFRRIDGGNGTDTLRLDPIFPAAGMTLDLTTVPDNRIADIECIDIRGGTGNPLTTANTLKLTAREVLNLTGNSNPVHSSNTLIIRRDSDDTIDKGSGWTQGSDEMLDGVTYQVFTQGAATILIEQMKTSPLNLASLSTDGTTLFGVDADDESGDSVSNAGDINGDGFDDFIIGTPLGAGPSNNKGASGETYIIFGQGTMPGTIDLTALGSAGIKIYGADSSDFSADSISSAGDVNADGYDDLIIGARLGDAAGNTKANTGECYIVFGAPALPATINLATATTGVTKIFGVDAGDQVGWSVSGAGDMNCDGFDDVIIGAPEAASSGNSKIDAGECYVVYGAATLAASIDLTSLGAAGMTIFGADAGDNCGVAVSRAGDINDDGFDDVLIGAHDADGPGNSRDGAGESYVIFGGVSLPQTIDLAVAGSGTVTVFGAVLGDRSGISVSPAGDVNEDGFDDLLLGADFGDAPNTSTLNGGTTYIVFGGPALPVSIDLKNLGSAGVILYAVDSLDNSGASVSTAGDVNCDGFDDILIGAIHARGPNGATSSAGESYLIFGQASLPPSIQLANLGSDGFTMFGVDEQDNLGNQVSDAGDVNGDGFGDFVVAAKFADGFNNAKSDSGESFLIFGKNFTNSPLIVGTSADETLAGDALPNSINGAGGNDTLIGNGGADVIHCGSGDDILAVSDVTFGRLDGGNGYDTLRLDGSGLTLNLTTLADNKLTNIEAIDIRGSGANSLVLDVREVLNLTANSNPLHTANTLTVRRDANDTVDIGTGWTMIGTETISAELYTVYFQGAATLKVTNQPPVFTSSATFSVPENQAAAFTVVATDADLPSQTVSYSINGGIDQSKFSITSGGALSFITAPDFESPADAGANNVYNLQITANDGSGGLAVQNIAVTVTPVNEHSPVFTTIAALHIFENTSLTLTIRATDADLPAQLITMSITGGADQSKFSVNASGLLSFITAPDYENPTDADANNVYEVQVTASDGNGGLTVQSITVHIDPSNDYFPVFTSPANFSVPENSTAVGLIEVADADLPAQTVSISITGGAGFDQLKFSLSPSGVLSFITAPDFEHPTDFGSNSVFNIDVFADDGLGAVNVQQIAITVLPLNDNVPIFSSPATFNVQENTTAVGTTVATDADLPAQTVTYSLTGGADQSKFSLAAGGVLTLIAAPDFENPSDAGGNNVYDVQVTASDGGGGLTVQNITVNVTSLNDNPTVFTSPAAFNVAENTTAVGTLAASDADLPLKPVTFAITGGADAARFLIIGGAALTFATAPNFEGPADVGTNNVYNLEVTANDGHGDLTVQNIAVTVTSVNELPAFTSPATFNVTENSTSVGTMLAIDPDFPAQPVIYSITGGADAARFLITSGGVLTFSAAPDFEVPSDAGANNVYNVQIAANDGNGGLTSQNLAVTVTSANDNLPVFTSPTTFNVPENTTAIGTVVATDTDLPAQPVTLALTGGLDAARFLISSGGILTFAAPPDFENPADIGSNNVYSLQVTANDGNGGLTVQNMVITVTPVNDNVPEFSSAATFNVPENSISIGTTLAVDTDLPVQTVTYSITGGADQSKFSITSSGALTFVAAPDFENPTDAGANNTYNLQVTANDGNGGLTVRSIAITVTGVDEIPPTVSIIPVSPDPHTSPVSTITIVFSEPVGSFDLSDLSLTRNGGTNLLNGSQSLTTVDNIIFVLSGLAGLTTADGVYVLALIAAASGVVDAGGNSLSNGAAESWMTDGTHPTATITPVTPSPQLSVVGSLTLLFSEPITGFGLSDLSLTRDGGVNLLTGSQTLTTSDNITFMLGNLSGLTAAIGSYQLRLSASESGIQDAVGNVLLADATGTWSRVNPAVTLNVNNNSIAEAVGKATVTATLSDVTDVDVTVLLNFTGTAAFPPDYSRTASQIVIPAGSASASLTLTAVSDGDLETTELVIVEISSITNGSTSGSQQTVVQIVDDDHAPVFTSPATVSVAENSAAVLTVTASDVDVPTQTITYSISGGVDQGLFSITSSGVLTFRTAPNFEAPADAGFNNVYNLQVRANDGHGGLVTQNLFVTVMNLDEIAPTVGINVVSPNPRHLPVDSLTFNFSEPVAGFDLNDLALTRNGSGNLLTGLQSISTLDNATFTLNGLSAVTDSDGSYELTLNSSPSGIVDGAGNALCNTIVANWLMDATPPTAAITAVSPDPRTTAVASMTIVFGEAVTGFDVSDLSLTRDGSPNLLTGSQTLTTFDNQTYTLNNLNGITGAVGVYMLSLRAQDAGIQDAVGNALATNSSEDWSRVNPTVSLGINTITISEVAGTSTVTATLSAVTDVNVTVVLGFGGTAAYPSDYLRGAAQIVIPAGNTTGSVVMGAVQDEEFEFTESIIVDITSVTNGVDNGTQQVFTQIMEDDHAPVFNSVATPSVAENSTSVLTVTATDADVPAQTITYSITGGVDQQLFSIGPAGALSFQSAPNFEAPDDSDLDNTYEVQVTANDGHGGATAQNITVTVTNVNEAPQLILGEPNVIWIKRQPPVTVLPQIIVGGVASLSGGTLTISVNATGTTRKLQDQFGIPSASALGASSGTHFANGHLTLQIQLSSTVTVGEIQSFLRGITFATKGKGLKTLTRTMDVSLADADGLFGSVRQTINVRKKG